jgi:pyruvate/2-oxoglutarate dehydrogenase complex dihydrolipoamide acyltransferase (E2) component
MADTDEQTPPVKENPEAQEPPQETEGATTDSTVTSSNSGVQPERHKLALSPSASQLEKELETSLEVSSAGEEGGKGDPFARVVEKKLRKIVKDAFEGQKVRGVFKSWYLGARPAKVRHHSTNAFDSL